MGLRVSDFNARTFVVNYPDVCGWDGGCLIVL